MTYTPAQQAALDAAANLADRDCVFSQEQVRRVTVYGMRQRAKGILWARGKQAEEEAAKWRSEADALEAMQHG